MIETRKRSLILNVILGAIVLLIAFLFWPKSKESKQSNLIDRSKTQIEIKVKRINIRQEPDEESPDIGDVYFGEVYTVLSHKDTEDFYWYHIKTATGIEGYIASEKENEFVKVISGYVDRQPPTIETDEKFLLFYDGEVKYDSVICKDDYSTCDLSYDISNPEFIEFKGIDKDMNETTLKIRYYNVYQLPQEYEENNINVKTNIKTNNSEGVYSIMSIYTLNKTIRSNNKSLSYSPIIDFYDENFEEVEDVSVYITSDILSNKCINNSNFMLKDEYKYNDLLKGSNLCINYTFNSSNSEIKYIAFGFGSDENYTNLDNYLAAYYSKYFIIN